MKNLSISKRTWSIIITILILLSLYSYMIIDVTVVQPKYSKKIDDVVVEFSLMKTYLDVKIPEMDTLLSRHTEELLRQNKQLQKLNNVARFIR